MQKPVIRYHRHPAEAESQISTQASTVYDRLHDDILTGKLEPGLKLRLKDLIEKYDTGNSPLREALNRLSANGMVVREENRGFRVAVGQQTDELAELDAYTLLAGRNCTPRVHRERRYGLGRTHCASISLAHP